MLTRCNRVPVTPESPTHFMLKWDGPIYPLKLFQAGSGSSPEPVGAGVLVEKQGKDGGGNMLMRRWSALMGRPCVCPSKSFPLPSLPTERCCDKIPSLRPMFLARNQCWCAHILPLGPSGSYWETVVHPSKGTQTGLSLTSLDDVWGCVSTDVSLAILYPEWR